MMKSVSFLLFESFESLDVYGPLSVFASRKMSRSYEVNTVSQHAGPIKSSQGVCTVAEHDFKSCPVPDILVIPGAHASITFCVLTSFSFSRLARCQCHVEIDEGPSGSCICGAHHCMAADTCTPCPFVSPHRWPWDTARGGKCDHPGLHSRIRNSTPREGATDSSDSLHWRRPGSKRRHTEGQAGDHKQGCMGLGYSAGRTWHHCLAEESPVGAGWEHLDLCWGDCR